MKNSFVARIESFIEKHALFQKEDKLLLAISGGGDSVCLFHLLRMLNYTFDCAHVNYKLRGDESDDDQVFVQKLCDQFNIKLHVIKSDLSNIKNVKGNLQEVARQKRYEFFRQLNLEHSYDKVLTAHTRTDDLETMLQMMARSSGIRGISGIPVKRYNISRPLLFATSNEIKGWMTEKKHHFRTDSSNESENYTRNRIRKKVIPALESIYPEFQSQAGKSLLILKEYNRFFQYQFEIIKESLVSAKNGYLSIDEVKLKKTGFAELLLFELLSPCGFNHNQCTDILNASQKGLRFLSNEYELITDNNAYCIRKRASSIEEFSLKIKKPGEFDLPVGKIRIWSTKNEKPNFRNDNLTAYLNHKNVNFPILLRSWSEGDIIYPFGMNGKRKKVKNILRDKKYNLFDKEKVFVLEIDGEIGWIPGIISSHNFRVLKNTEKMICVEFTPYLQTVEQR